ncbi:TIGR04053 family radical SAM/SPASM domain-containing protein [Cellulomonas denverensis]|nr:TIGR04053 family radical SAM/SPASM domain-containing protein [Cellulomonas denverensis]GIG23890.1 radical SAM protein [Cellulomonas denverensis]
MSHPSAAGAPRSKVDFAQRPMLVFWEATRACGVACRHCRASALTEPLPGELDPAEGLALIDQIAGFGRPHPILVITGGDCLTRPDLFELVEHAVDLGIPTALAPAVTPRLTPAVVDRIAASGVRAVSVSLDGATAATHEGVRAVPRHYADTVAAIEAFVAAGLDVQINTVVMRSNLHELADVAEVVARTGARIWEVFFLVETGRGTSAGSITPAEHLDACHLLHDASHYGFIVRTVEAPFFRRVVAERRAGGPVPESATYRRLSDRLVELLGPPRERSSAHTAATRDGKGIVFVAHDGEVNPAGFLPLALGNVRERALAEIYRDDPLLRRIRAAEFTGRCGSCGYADLCGGSRARAYAATGDPLGEDTACPFDSVA